jgi:hypothetical protein
MRSQLSKTLANQKESRHKHLKAIELMNSEALRSTDSEGLKISK